jgi:carbonic anhydrase
MSKLKSIFVAQLVLAAALTPMRGPAQDWAYDGAAGPSFWGGLDPSYAACGDGTSQSPIDLESRDTTERYFDLIQFHYADSFLTILNNGHTVEVKYETGSWISVTGRTFDLEQFHFHSPSEHTYGRGAHYNMEMHLVHRNSRGALAVVAVMIREGQANEALASVWEHLPLEEGEQEFPGVEINADDVLPKDKRAFHYTGSLTTPPCSEGVRWFVLREPIEMSAEQIAQFRGAIAATCCSNNNRPTQNRNDRRVWLDIIDVNN